MTTTARQLCFDFSRPFGSFDGHCTDNHDTLRCSLSRKTICFYNDKSGSGYNHGVQLSKLVPQSTVHVMSFRMEGLVEEYGMNAIAIVLVREEAAMKLEDSLWMAKSQCFAPFRECIVTLQLDTAKGEVTLVAEPVSCDTSLGKRKREVEEPRWLPDASVALKPVEGLEEVWMQTFKVPTMKIETPPRVGFFMGGFAQNKLSIVDPHTTRALNAVLLPVGQLPSSGPEGVPFQPACMVYK